jgi:hypothetical protein
MQSEGKNFWIIEVKVSPRFAQSIPIRLLLEAPAAWLLLEQHILPERAFMPISAALNTTFPVTFIGGANAERGISDRYLAKKCDYSDADCRVWLIDNAARPQQ